MNIIVTGASRGIGYELVKIVSADSTHTVIAVARNEAKLLHLKNACFNSNSVSKVIAIACDLSNENEIEKLLVEIQKHTDTIDVLINNAGAIVKKPFAEITKTDLEYVYNVNVFSVIRLIQGVLPMLNTKTKSHIVNISSIGGFQGSMKFSGLSAYSSSKAALASLTECLAEEYKDSTIAFNCLALGAAQTEMLNEAFPGYQAPLSANEMAQFIANFSLTAQQYMNGKVIPVSLSNP
jgi:NAD(P)-dependent dehydrogenase (short-subunit alcohol dehydrogenase family)